jgi:hypothetical protein
MVCEFCGATGEDVCETFEPYALEIRGVEEKITVCDDCFYDLAQDV